MLRVCSVSTLVLISVIPLNSAFSQSSHNEIAREYLKQARLMEEANQFEGDIADILMLSADMDTTYVEANYQAGDMVLRSPGRRDMAIKYLLRVYRQAPDYKFDIEYKIGRSYHYGLEFDNAITYYKLYIEKFDKKADYKGKDRIPLELVQQSIRACQIRKQ